MLIYGQEERKDEEEIHEQIEKQVTHAYKYAHVWNTDIKYPHVHPHTRINRTQCVIGLLSASKVGLLDTPQMDNLYAVQVKSLSVSLKAKSRM